jgi:hypothetical protein
MMTTPAPERPHEGEKKKPIKEKRRNRRGRRRRSEIQRL